MARLAHPVPEPCLPGQESVWSFPRPSIAQPVRNHLKIIYNGHVLAETTAAARTIETSHPPTYYFPSVDVDLSLLREAAAGRSASGKDRHAILVSFRATEQAGTRVGPNRIPRHPLP